MMGRTCTAFKIDDNCREHFYNMSQLLKTLLGGLALVLLAVPNIDGQTAPSLSQAEQRQDIPAIERYQFSQQYYANEAAWWMNYLKENQASEQGWLNYYKALRYSNYTPQSRVISKNQQKQLDAVIEEMKSKVSGTFAYHYAAYLNGNKGESAYEDLVKAYQLRSDVPEIWDDLLSYAIIYNKQEEAIKFAKQLATHSIYNAREVSYNRNVLNSVERDAILITNGNVDTYPILILQLLNQYRIDVKVICLDWLNNEAYVQQVSQWLGRNIRLNASLKELLQSTKNVYVALTVPPSDIEQNAQNLYCTGLALKYSRVEIDNLSALRNNWERLFEKDLIDEQEELNRNYLVPLVQLKQHYKELGEIEKHQVVQAYFEKLAKGLGLNKAYNTHKD